MSSPIELILYGPGDEPGKTFVKKVVSWGLLKRALRLSEQIDGNNLTPAPEPDDWISHFKRWIHRNDRKISSAEETMDALSEFVVDVFDGQFTVQQLEEGAEASEILTVMRSIVARAQTMVPTNPLPRTRKRH